MLPAKRTQLRCLRQCTGYNPAICIKGQQIVIFKAHKAVAVIAQLQDNVIINHTAEHSAVLGKDHGLIAHVAHMTVGRNHQPRAVRMVEEARREERRTPLHIIIIARQALPSCRTQIGGTHQHALDYLTVIIELYNSILLELDIVRYRPALRHQLGILV